MSSELALDPGIRAAETQADTWSSKAGVSYLRLRWRGRGEDLSGLLACLPLYA